MAADAPRVVSFGDEPPLAATPEEREAAFEERWRIGGFSFLGAFYDLLLDERALPTRSRRVVGRTTGVVARATDRMQNQFLFEFIRNVINVKL